MNLIICPCCLKLGLKCPQVFFPHLEHEHSLPLIPVFRDSSITRPPLRIFCSRLCKLRLGRDNHLIRIFDISEHRYQFLPLLHFSLHEFWRGSPIGDLHGHFYCHKVGSRIPEEARGMSGHHILFMDLFINSGCLDI